MFYLSTLVRFATSMIFFLLSIVGTIDRSSLCIVPEEVNIFGKYVCVKNGKILS